MNLKNAQKQKQQNNDTGKTSSGTGRRGVKTPFACHLFDMNRGGLSPGGSCGVLSPSTREAAAPDSPYGTTCAFLYSVPSPSPTGPACSARLSAEAGGTTGGALSPYIAKEGRRLSWGCDSTQQPVSKSASAAGGAAAAGSGSGAFVVDPTHHGVWQSPTSRSGEGEGRGGGEGEPGAGAEETKHSDHPRLLQLRRSPASRYREGSPPSRSKDGSGGALLGQPGARQSSATIAVAAAGGGLFTALLENISLSQIVVSQVTQEQEKQEEHAQKEDDKGDRSAEGWGKNKALAGAGTTAAAVAIAPSQSVARGKEGDNAETEGRRDHRVPERQHQQQQQLQQQQPPQRQQQQQQQQKQNQRQQHEQQQQQQQRPQQHQQQRLSLYDGVARRNRNRHGAGRTFFAHEGAQSAASPPRPASGAHEKNEDTDDSEARRDQEEPASLRGPGAVSSDPAVPSAVRNSVAAGGTPPRAGVWSRSRVDDIAGSLMMPFGSEPDLSPPAATPCPGPNPDCRGRAAEHSPGGVDTASAGVTAGRHDHRPSPRGEALPARAGARTSKYGTHSGGGGGGDSGGGVSGGCGGGGGDHGPGVSAVGAACSGVAGAGAAACAALAAEAAVSTAAKKAGAVERPALASGVARDRPTAPAPAPARAREASAQPKFDPFSLDRNPATQAGVVRECAVRGGAVSAQLTHAGTSDEGGVSTSLAGETGARATGGVGVAVEGLVADCAREDSPPSCASSSFNLDLSLTPQVRPYPGEREYGRGRGGVGLSSVVLVYASIS